MNPTLKQLSSRYARYRANLKGQGKESPRISYPKELKEEAACLVRQAPRDLAAIAKELGTHHANLRCWVKTYGPRKEQNALPTSNPAFLPVRITEDRSSGAHCIADDAQPTKSASDIQVSVRTLTLSVPPNTDRDLLLNLVKSLSH